MKKRKALFCHILFYGLIFALILMVFPFPTHVHYQGTAVEYSEADKTVAVEHKVRIEGRYYRSVLLKDFYKGIFYISGVSALTPDKQVELALSPGKTLASPAFQDSYGQPGCNEIAVIACGRDFFPIAIRFYNVYEKSGTHSGAGTDPNDARFLVTDAETRDEALSLFQALFH